MCAGAISPKKGLSRRICLLAKYLRIDDAALSFGVCCSGNKHIHVCAYCPNRCSARRADLFRSEDDAIFIQP